jgi:hypothetical protein
LPGTPKNLEVLIMQESDSGVNRQATVTEIEKGWLAGIIDGEGCIHIDIDTKGGSHPYITVTNTNILIIEKVADIWKRLGVGCRVYRFQNKPPRAVKINAMVFGFKRLKPALTAIMPYLVGKKDEALLLYRFVESRLKVDMHGPNETRKITNQEMKYILELKRMKNQYRVLTDYTPNTRKSDDIVGTLRRRREVGRNVQPHLV